MPGSGEMADQHCFCCKNKAAFRDRLFFPNTFVGKGICNTFFELQLCRRLCTSFPYRQTSPVGNAVCLCVWGWGVGVGGARAHRRALLPC